jgi:putative spermidine/putrescine transport system permease protein
MFSGQRGKNNLAILALASCLVAMSILLPSALDLVRRRDGRMRGMSPGRRLAAPAVFT